MKFLFKIKLFIIRLICYEKPLRVVFAKYLSLMFKTFRPHYHIPVERHSTITQESWVVIQGKIKVILYDIDQNIIAERILNQGDISITFYGGHNYISLEDNTLVYEYKIGPYMGQVRDKEFI